MPATKSARPAVAAKTLGELIDELQHIRDEKRKASAEVERLSAAYAEVEAKVEEQLSSMGLDKASGSTATVSLSKVVAANVEDWDAFYKFIKRTGYFHLLQRRTSDPACRELFEQKGSIPGVTPVSLTKLNLRSK